MLTYSEPGVYYDDEAVEVLIKYCENESTLTDSVIWPTGFVQLWANNFTVGIISKNEVYTRPNRWSWW